MSCHMNGGCFSPPPPPRPAKAVRVRRRKGMAREREAVLANTSKIKKEVMVVQV